MTDDAETRCCLRASESVERVDGTLAIEKDFLHAPGRGWLLYVSMRDMPLFSDPFSWLVIPWMVELFHIGNPAISVRNASFLVECVVSPFDFGLPRGV